jgi:hypothetical protein
MSIYRGNLEEELKRNLNSQKVFSRKIESLLKGSICKKKINSHEYYYLMYREDNKVITKYIGSVKNSKIDSLQKELDKSDEVRRVLVELKKNEKKLRKAIRVL